VLAGAPEPFPRLYAGAISKRANAETPKPLACNHCRRFIGVHIVKEPVCGCNNDVSWFHRDCKALRCPGGVRHGVCTANLRIQ
jgi:hypothetical protein